MLQAIAASLFVLLLFAPPPAAAQMSCYPYCDYVHHYGPYDYSYVRPGLDCYPVCGPDGSCAPVKTCIVSRPSGTVTVRSFTPRGTVTVRSTPTAVTFTDPSLGNPAVVRPRRVTRARRR